VIDRAQSDRLLADAQAGDGRALDQLLRAHRDTVFRYALRFCRSADDAEDAVQETLWAATRAIGSFQCTAAITTWLFTIVRNQCFRLLRRRGGQELADELPPVDLSRSLEEEVGLQQIYRILSSALARLEPAHREVILLRDVEGLTAPEAADRLGLSVQALKSRLHRAREALRNEVVLPTA
jgi:RNA polymerase sigma-70 factor (ECF subfamily)